jgi:phosphatidylinositol-3-phosphatase
VAACTKTAAGVQPTAHPAPSASVVTSPQVSPSPQPSPAAEPAHVFLIVLENRSYSQALSTPYIADLASKYGLATNYSGITHPSLPNYLAMTSGSTWGVTDDGWHPLPAGGLGAQLDAAGMSWRAYMEGMTAGCYHNVNRYALKHNPFAYYGGQCPSQVVPFSQFASDMSGAVPQFVWITPDLCNDGHDCSNSVVSSWLSQTVPVILNSDAWLSGGVLFITYDEGEDSANSVLTLVIRDRQVNLRSSVAYNHYSLLASIEDLLGLPRLGAAAPASPMTDLLATKPVPTPPRQLPST